MSDRAAFLKRYAARILGRDLVGDEADLVSQETSRSVVRALCGTFTVEKKVSKPKTKAKSKVTTPEKELETVINEIESSSSKSVE